jgi:hypothetical protein
VFIGRSPWGVLSVSLRFEILIIVLIRFGKRLIAGSGRGVRAGIHCSRRNLFVALLRIVLRLEVVLLSSAELIPPRSSILIIPPILIPIGIPLFLGLVLGGSRVIQCKVGRSITSLIIKAFSLMPGIVFPPGLIGFTLRGR